MNKRVFVLLFDSFGVGASADAAQYGDAGSDTLGHIVDVCARGEADVDGLRQGPLAIPNLIKMGLAKAHFASTNIARDDLDTAIEANALYGYAIEQSKGKDTPSGHWEIAGVPVMFDWGYFADKQNSFPPALLDELIKRANLPGVLANCHASGTTIIEQCGEEHMQSGKPIVYTSADSVFQIAAHEDSFGLDNLYRLCEIARELVDEYNIGRVIARPFTGQPGNFTRTANRRDYATPPPAPTLFDQLKAAGREVIAIGKTADIFAHQGITQTIKADGNLALYDVTKQQLSEAAAGSIVFTNFVDFDSKYGHRRNVAGYANALEEMDAKLAEFQELMQPGDIAIIAADHGCDPTAEGSDHTREHIPVIVFGPGLKGKTGTIGARESFADIGQSIAEYLEIAPLEFGTSFLG